MRVIIFGVTGMIGQGVLRECMFDESVTQVLTIGRRSTGRTHPKLREIVVADLTDRSAMDALADKLTGYDACFFCLGVSSVGMGEDQYRAITYDVTMLAAEAVGRHNPEITFIYVSGQGTDSSEQGRIMWARVKGRTENALLERFANGYMFRPGYIQPKHGAKSRTRLYNALYLVAAPFYPLIRRIWPTQTTTTERMGRAMLNIARSGASKRVLETADINAAAEASGAG